MYERAGVPSYWVVGPVEPRLLVWEMHDGAYVDVADVVGAPGGPRRRRTP